jgi:ribosomal protein S18 acetylase RimI-like enzyme
MELSSLIEFNSVFSGVLNDLATAAFGGTAILLFQVTVAHIRDKRLKAKLDLTGDYITYFYDTQDGQRVRSTARARLRQKGQVVQGQTTLLPHVAGKERAWDLKADIMNDGNILGHYVCTTEYQSGMGSFSLRAVTRDRLLGHWSGYDSDNQIMNYGEYEFKRIARVDIVPAEERHDAAIHKISAETLGDGFIPDVDVLRTNPHGVTLVAIDGASGKTVGFASGKLLEKGGLRGELPNFPSGQLDRTIRFHDAKGQLAVIDAIGVDLAFQGKGIGLKLAEALNGLLERRGARLLIAAAWSQTPDRSNPERILVNAAGMLEASGFKKHTTVKTYWKDDCDRGRFLCPVRCDTCTCGAIFYLKHIEDIERRRRFQVRLRR